MIAASVVLAGILHLLPTIAPARAEELADSIGAAAGSVEEAALLAVTNRRESTFAKDLEDCRRTHDQNRGWSAYALHKHYLPISQRKAACANPTLAAMFALTALAHGKTYAGKHSRYTGRRCSDPEVRLRVKLTNETLAVMRAAGDAT